MKSVTICIPCYNSEKTIRNALDSIINQKYKNFNIIVSDNHSTDSTRDIIIKEYINKGVKLVTCSKAPVKNGSTLDNCLSAAQNWNSLIHLTDSDFIGIYHADDIYEETILSKQVDAFYTNPNASIIFSMLKYIDGNGVLIKQKKRSINKIRDLVYDHIDFIKEIASSGHFFSSSGVLISRKAWEKAGSFNASVWEHQFDTEFWIRLSRYGSVIILKDELVHHRIHASQETTKWKLIYKYKYLPIINLIESNIKNLKYESYSEQNFYFNFKRYKLKETMRVSINFINDKAYNEAITLIENDFEFKLPKKFKEYRSQGYRFIIKLILFNMIAHTLKYRLYLLNRYLITIYNFIE